MTSLRHHQGYFLFSFYVWSWWSAPLNRRVTGHFPQVFIKGHDPSMFNVRPLTPQSSKHLIAFPSASLLSMSHALWPRDLIVMSRWHQEKAEINSCSHKHVLEAQRWFGFYLEAVFELLGDEEEDYGIDAGVDGRHVDAEVVEHQQEAATTEEERTASVEEDWEVTLFYLSFFVSVCTPTSAARSGERRGICRRFSSAGDSSEAGTSTERRSEPGRTRLWPLLGAVERKPASEADSLILCVAIRRSAAPRRVCASTCLTCSLRAIRRLPFRCRSISPVIRP